MAARPLNTRLGFDFRNQLSDLRPKRLAASETRLYLAGAVRGSCGVRDAVPKTSGSHATLGDEIRRHVGRDLERISRAAEKVKREVERGYEVAVVVSAMSGETNKLVQYVRDASAPPGANQPGFYDAREYDAVVSAGEQVTSGLMALTLQRMDVPARSWQGWQVPVKTSSAHGAARIEDIDTTALDQKFGEGLHAVIAGFQGISPDGRIATLGRGGSDTTAVAFAAALGAERCDIYTDVDGVYTTDPRIERRARKLDKIAYEEMLELASLGAKVLQTRSVELAMRYKVRLQVLSSFED
jgi:aspartate kinase